MRRADGQRRMRAASLRHQEHGDGAPGGFLPRATEGTRRGGVDYGDKKVLESLGCRAGSAHQSCWLVLNTRVLCSQTPLQLDGVM